MKTETLGDIASGAALAVIGGTVATYAYLYYSLGTFSRMGPGMFPLILGIFLAILGVSVAVASVLRASGELNLEIVPALCILAGGIAFGLLINRLGMAPAVVASVLIASFATRTLSWLRCAIFAAILAAISVVLFSILLQLPIPAFAWSW